jgi:hypothetical protein
MIEALLISFWRIFGALSLRGNLLDLGSATVELCMKVLFATGQEAVKACQLLSPSPLEGGISFAGYIFQLLDY